MPPEENSILERQSFEETFHNTERLWTTLADSLASPQKKSGHETDMRQQPWKTLFARADEIAKTNIHDLITLLITALTAPDRATYLPAAYILRHMTDQNHGFNSFGKPEEREAAYNRWSQWWFEARDDFGQSMSLPAQSTLIVDEMPGRIVGNDEDPPGRVLHLDQQNQPIWDIGILKMPYDAVPTPNNCYLIGIIRSKAVWKVALDGEIIERRDVGGYPCSLQLLPNGHTLVSGWDYHLPGFVREYDSTWNLVWQQEHLHWPWKAERLKNGNTLIADAGTNRVFEVNVEGQEVWAVDELGPPNPTLFDNLGPVYCQRLGDGNTLVSIRGLSKVVELNPTGQVVWEVNREHIQNQYSAIRLWNGNALIADGGNFRVIEIDVDKNVVWEKGGFGYPAKAYRY